MTQHEAAKALADALTCTVKGLGFVMKVEIENEVPYPDHRPTLIAGMREALGILQGICQCAAIDPRELAATSPVPPQPPSSRIIIASR